MFATKVSVIDLYLCKRRQMLRRYCFTVLLRQVFILFRAENVRSEVADATGNRPLYKWRLNLKKLYIISLVLVSPDKWFFYMNVRLRRY